MATASANTNHSDMIGKVLANRYELLECVGTGGMAAVYRALDRNTKKMVAVKILRTELCKNAAFISRFEQESTAVSRMTHPNVANLLDVGVEGELRYLVIEFVLGTSLKEMINQNGAIRSDTAGQIAIRILSALQHAHQNGIIHRDVKPQNILIDKQGVVKVLDFGIARFVGPASELIEDVPLGSVHYFSPEQARGQVADEKSDIYSVGVVLYEMLAGVQPFMGESQVEVALKHLEDIPIPPTQVNNNASPALAQVALRAMEKDPAKRYASAGAMIQAIRQALHFPNVTDPRPLLQSEDTSKTAELMARKSKRLAWTRRLLTVGFTALLLVVIGLLVMNLLNSLRSRIIMPTVTNYDYNVANEMLLEMKLVVSRRDRMVEIGKENLVIDQDPMPGALLMPGAEVTLTVSMSEYDLIMPDLTHKPMDEAVKIIGENQMVSGPTETVISEARVGQVIEQVPAAGTRVRYGTNVLLKVSGGLMIVPDMIGLAEKDARAALGDGRLVLTEVIYHTINDSAQDGVVMDQSPLAYTKVILETPVTITVGRLEQRVYLGEAAVELKLDADTQIKVKLVKSDGTEELQYSALHPRGESTLRFLVRGDIPGAHDCRIYKEDELFQTISVTLK
ncbi:serine/threonine protein kinase [Clostridia bacterium]|nr:serine/threonine protein kinase [Clostridia bacterium]